MQKLIEIAKQIDNKTANETTYDVLKRYFVEVTAEQKIEVNALKRVQSPAALIAHYHSTVDFVHANKLKSLTEVETSEDSEYFSITKSSIVLDPKVLKDAVNITRAEFKLYE